MELTITKIVRTPRTSAAGKPFTSVGIKTVEHGDRFLSGFSNAENSGWKEGTKINVEVAESVKLDKNGKPYLNFVQPKKDDVLRELRSELSSLRTDISTLMRMVSGIENKLK